MSWDIVVADHPAVASISDIRGADARPLGTRDEVIAKICQVVPEADFSDPVWGFIRGAGFSIEINIGDDPERVDGFMLHLRGGEGAFDMAARLLEHLPWHGWDVSSGELFAPETARADFDRWRDWRDQAIGSIGSP